MSHLVPWNEHSRLHQPSIELDTREDISFKQYFSEKKKKQKEFDEKHPMKTGNYKIVPLNVLKLSTKKK